MKSTCRARTRATRCRASLQERPTSDIRPYVDRQTEPQMRKSSKSAPSSNFWTSQFDSRPDQVWLGFSGFASFEATERPFGFPRFAAKNLAHCGAAIGNEWQDLRVQLRTLFHTRLRDSLFKPLLKCLKLLQSAFPNLHVASCRPRIERSALHVHHNLLNQNIS